MIERPPPPETEAELLDRAERWSGARLGALAEHLGQPVPPDLRRAKGFVGQLLELALGATAGSRAAPDFEALGIELKSIPVDATGRPLESTFVCTIPLLDVGELEWSASPVKRKLSRVLWIPVLGTRSVPVAERRLGAPSLWSPDAEQEADLRWDWEELSGLIGRGALEEVTGHLGKVMQVRPKARDSHALRRAHDADGASVLALPRGFYLRATFTANILARSYLLPERLSD